MSLIMSHLKPHPKTIQPTTLDEIHLLAECNVLLALTPLMEGTAIWVDARTEPGNKPKNRP